MIDRQLDIPMENNLKLSLRKVTKKSIGISQVGSKHSSEMEKLKMDQLACQCSHVDALSPGIPPNKHIFVCHFCATYWTCLTWTKK